MNLNLDLKDLSVNRRDYPVNEPNIPVNFLKLTVREKTVLLPVKKSK